MSSPESGEAPRPIGPLRLRARGWSLRRRVAVSFTAFAVLFAGLIAMSVLSLVDFMSKGNEVVDRWDPAAAYSQDLLSDLVNQETGVRGYVLTRNTEFLLPFQQYAAKQASDEKALIPLLRPYPALLTNLAEFGQTAASWQQQTAAPLIVLVNHDDASARTLVDDPGGQVRFNLVRASEAKLLASVQQLKQSALAERQSAATLLIVALVITLVLLALAAFAVWRALHRWVLAPAEQLAVPTREVAEGMTRQAIQPAGPPEFIDLGTDVETMRRRIVDELGRIELAGAELARSNADLEQFAYVASHDLSEPLRKVANFCQLLERQYGPQLDDRAREYIAFAVDGAKRMQALISDLLTLSRVGRTSDGFVPVDLGEALAAALRNIEDPITKSGGGVGSSDLPTVLGDPALITSLFENLIGNAIKYRGEQPPLIVVTAVANRGAGTWTISVKDNGIGIDAQYAERIFVIFQRLHLREDYSGTGIGLALCRKIVEFHGGRIWLDTAVPSGATFRFTLPERPVVDPIS